jgi:hypothetical protein
MFSLGQYEDDTIVDESITFESGYCISRQQMELVYGHNFTERIIKFSKSFSQLNLNDIEIALICAIVFTSIRDENLADLISLSDRVKINNIHQGLVEALQFEILNRKKVSNQMLASNNNHDQIEKILKSQLIQINHVIDELHYIGHLHNEQVQYYRDYKYKVKIPHLLSEIYEIENGIGGIQNLHTPDNTEQHQQQLNNNQQSNQNYYNQNQFSIQHQQQQQQNY